MFYICDQRNTITMPTLKTVILPHHKREDGTYNVKIRLTHKRRSVYIATSFYVDKSDINRKFGIKDNFLLNELQILLSEYRRLIIVLRGNVNQYNAKELAEHLQKQYHGEAFTLDMLQYAGKVRTKLASEDRETTGILYVTVINSLNRYAGYNVEISHINTGFLRDYEAWMRKSGMTESGISLYMRTLRALFNRARDEFNGEDRGDIKIPHYPFSKYRVPAGEPSQGKALTVAQIRVIRDCKPTGRGELARDIFMISFYLAGMNIADIYECTKPAKGRITYKRKKTRTRRRDSATMSIAVPDELLPYLEKYPSQTSLFGFSGNYKNLEAFRKAIGKGMEQVRDLSGVPGVTSYYARHSWATIARNVCKISKDDIAFALNHVRRDTKVTDIYIEEDFSIVDRAIRKVLDKIKKGP
jgi:integrase